MSDIPTYNFEENLRRIRMQKNLAFVVVEGADDIPIYESCLSSMIPDCQNYDVVFSGGKTPIRNFIKTYSATNAVFIIDRDFNDIGLVDERVISLDRYSIENYFICEEVISYSLQFILGCKFKDALEAFSLDEFIDDASEALGRLIKVIFFYQKEIAPKHSEVERPAWSDYFLCENSSWRLCRDKVQELINLLLPEPELIVLAEAYYDDNFSIPGSLIDNFPGKMLKHSLQRYVRQKIIDIKPSARGKFGDVETARVMLSASMHRSTSMSKVLKPVVEFLRGREPLQALDG